MLVWRDGGQEHERHAGMETGGRTGRADAGGGTMSRRVVEDITLLLCAVFGALVAQQDGNVWLSTPLLVVAFLFVLYRREGK